MAEDTDIASISYKLYKIVNREIGSKEIIKIRRTVNKVSDKLEQEENRGLCNHDHLSSGSRAEGFRFPTSDDDQMIVYNTIKVIMDDSTIQPIANITLLKMEIDQTRPGFCILRFVSQDNMPDLDIVELCVPYKDGLYLTNTSWKNRSARFIQDSYTWSL
ncbi:hypothetical protein FSP39_016103 [Pinctada imbricata]|uniref:Uncharacterized protein n=1 Tax=Pinctada imbricata TaxID=66713 RepID=A0AA89C7K0_PINIB|nr:hypothetical protein FSP39_016103 [Pinctada imbricata]